jgi:hypothetical protein
MTRIRLILRTSLIAGALASLALPAHAEPAVFTVGNYPVEANAKDAVAAKAAALADGQQSALRSLFRRIVPVTAYRRLKAIPQPNAADLVDGVSIKDERNSSTQYLATLDVSFRADGVRNVLRRNGIPFVDQQGPQTLLVPLYRTTADGPYTSGKGVWFEAWKSLDLSHTLTPVKLDTLRPEILPDTIKALATGTGGADRIITGEYKTDRVVFALAQPEKISSSRWLAPTPSARLFSSAITKSQVLTPPMPLNWPPSLGWASWKGAGRRPRPVPSAVLMSPQQVAMPSNCRSNSPR